MAKILLSSEWEFIQGSHDTKICIIGVRLTKLWWKTSWHLFVRHGVTLPQYLTAYQFIDHGGMNGLVGRCASTQDWTRGTWTVDMLGRTSVSLILIFAVVQQSKDIEMIQKRCLRIIFPNMSYNDALTASGLERRVYYESAKRNTNRCH